jgi:hypothetical protein
MLPVVQTGAAEIVVVDPKPKRSDHPELRPNGDARAADTPGVIRNLRLVQNDVQARLVLHVDEITPALYGVKLR